MSTREGRAQKGMTQIGHNKQASHRRPFRGTARITWQGCRVGGGAGNSRAPIVFSPPAQTRPPHPGRL
eukprot:606397-Rhodomonas_salina.1